MQTDYDLVKRFQNGELYAIELLVDRHKDIVYTFILSKIKDKNAAEDIFQDVFLKVIEKINKGVYSEKGKFLEWLMKVSYHTCIDYFRKIKRVKHSKGFYANETFHTASFFETGTEKRIIQKERMDLLRLVLEQLPEEQRDVIIMRHYGGIKFCDIASLTNCSINTALGRMRYGLINMKKMMTDKAYQSVVS